MAKMQIRGDDINRKTFVISGATTGPFAFDFPFFQNEDLRVIHTSAAGVETEKTLTTDFTVTGTAVDEGFQGGEVNLVASVSDGTVVVFTDTTIERLFSHPDAGPFDTKILNKDVLKAFQICKEISLDIDRGVRLADGDTASSLQLPDPATRASKYLTFSADGLGFVMAAGDGGAVPISTWAETLVDDTSAAAARTTLGLSDLATLQNDDEDLALLADFYT